MLQKMFLIAVAALLLLVLQSSPCKATQNFFEDTVWTKTTDQMSGFYQVKFSNTDSMIVAHGYAIAYVYKTLSGEQIARLPFNAEVHFFNNDLNFIQLAPSRDRLMVFETKEFKAIDTLEFDGETIADVEISKDEKFLVAVVASGYRIWSIDSRKILRTKKYIKEENQTKFQIEQICITNDNSKIIATEYREFTFSEYPYSSFSLRHNIYDFETFDSLGTFIDKAYFRLSNSNEYIAFKRSLADYGVEIYDFSTKELVQKLQVNGYDLTGIEFSYDDNYIITTNCFGALMRIWNLEKGTGIYDYKDGGYGNLDITSDSKYIISSIGGDLFFYPAKYGCSSVPNQNEIYKTIYPNPTTENVTIEFESKNSGNTKIELINEQAATLKTIFNGFLEEGFQSFQIQTKDIPSGNYFIVVQNEIEYFAFQLVVNH